MTLSSLETSKEASQAANIPGYELRGELGRGTFGVVWEAVRVQTGQRVALKLVLHEQRLHWEYFRRELALLVDLEDHPYTLTVLDADLTHRPPFIVTPLVEGGSLQNHQKAELPVCYRWIEQMAEALHYIHSKGVIHCDLKPSNIFVTGTETIRVGDLGQSRRVVDGEVSWGTIGYMAPEQCDQPLGKRATPSVLWDVYGFGATAYWLLTKKRARILDTDQSRLAGASGAGQLASFYVDCLRKNPLIPIRKLNPTVNAGVAAIVERCLELDPQRRTQSMEDVLEDFGRWRRGDRLLALRPWTPGYRFKVALRKPAVQLSLLLLLLLILSLYYGVTSYRQRQFALLTQSGLHALESGRTEEAYLQWVSALSYAPGDSTTRARLSFLPVLMTFPGRAEISTVAFNGDGTLLATGARASSTSPQASARVWDSTDGRQILEVRHHDGIQKIAFSQASPDLLATASWDRTGVVVDVKARNLLFQIQHGQGRSSPSLTDVVFSQDGKWLASTAQDGSLRLWSVPSGRLQPLELPAEGPEGQYLLSQPVTFDTAGKLLAGLSTPRSLRLWDTQSGKVLPFKLEESSDINDLHFHPRLPIIADACEDGSVSLWSTTDGKVVERLLHSSRVNYINFSPTGDFLAAGGEDGVVRIWDLRVRPWKVFDLVHQKPVRNLAFYPRSPLLAVGMGEKEELWSLSEANGAVRVWDLLSRKAMSDTIPHEGPVTQLAFHPRLEQLVSSCGSGLRVSSLYPGSARCWELRLAGRGDHPLLPEPAGWNGVEVATGGLQVRDANGQNLCQVSHGPGIKINAWAFSQDGQLLVTGAEDRTARIWRLPAGTPLGNPLPHEGRVTAVAFDRAGGWVATSSLSWNSTTVRCWDVADGTPVSPPLYGAQGEVHQLDFSQDGYWLVADGLSWNVQVPASESDDQLAASVTRRLKAGFGPSGLVVPRP
ncbi:MAG: WD40 repeat domain-containing serine/threonine protein kinase [Vulcanimicrobiota bacterium]